MLSDLVRDLLNAKESGDKKAIEKAYRNLERVGMDRRTADAFLESAERRKDL